MFGASAAGVALTAFSSKVMEAETDAIVGEVMSEDSRGKITLCNCFAIRLYLGILP
jgi:hypothetical protein